MKLNKKQQLLMNKKNEYYVKNEKIYKESEDNIVKQTNEDIKQSHFDDFIQDLKFELFNYVDHEGLPLCENLDYINFYNYIECLIKGKFT
jgi:hypothetical protein